MKPTVKRPKIKKRKPSAQITRSQSRYRFKQGFADTVKARSQKSYRASKGADFELTGNVILRSLETLSDFSTNTLVENSLTGETHSLPIVIQTQLAEILDKPYQTIWRWITETNQLPKPALIDNTENRGRGVYHVEEVRVIVAVLGEHFLSYKYYRKDHASARDRMFAEIEALRMQNYGEQPNGKTNTQGQSPRSKKIRRSRSRRSAG